MKFLVDHCVSVAIANFLHAKGHEVITVADILPVDTPDIAIASTAIKIDAVLLTFDNDFRAMKKATTKATRRLILQTNLVVVEAGAFALDRLATDLDLIDYELARARLAGRRFFACINNKSVWIER